MYKTETHLHTAESSFCARIPAEEVVKIYKEEGYHTIIDTVHYNETYFSHISEDWDKRIDYMFEGFKKARALGDQIGLNVLFAIELTLNRTMSDYLIYGITEDFLRKNPNLYKLSLSRLVYLCKKNKFLIIQAHPYRVGGKMSPLRYRLPLEIYNGRHNIKPYNDLAVKYAIKHKLIGISGSDFHELDDFRGGILSKNEIKTIDDFITTVLSRDFEIIPINNI